MDKKAPARVPERTAPTRRPSVRRKLTEDEADILFCEKHKADKRYPLKRVLDELGIDEEEVGLSDR